MTFAAPGLGAGRSTGGSAPGGVRTLPDGGGDSTAQGNSSLNNTSGRLGTAVGTFVSWVVRALTIVVLLVIVTLVAGGIVNYVVVGRHRGEWTPDQAEGLRPPPSADGASPPTGPPPGPGGP